MLDKNATKSRILRLIVDLTTFILCLLTIWTLNAEVFHFGTIELAKQREQVLPLKLNAADLGIDKWKIEAVEYEEDEGQYSVVVIDSQEREIAELNIDAANGNPKTKLLSNLTVGSVTKKQKDSFAPAAVLYEGKTIARIKVDPISGHPLNSSELLPEDLDEPLGWTSFALILEGTIYYMWRRSAFTLFKSVKPGKQPFAFMQSPLNYHCTFSIAALLLAFFHTLNWLTELSLTLGWLTFMLMAIVTVTGLLGKYLAHIEFIRLIKHRLHMSHALLLTAVFIMHALTKM
jgi:hypothetical protein